LSSALRSPGDMSGHGACRSEPVADREGEP
jgi:hypothetical protein